ncbi:MAG: hypothetical protein HON68_04250 [Gammaproteobacteria bacterium]|nr:hypothetical protein [Gammaproteobacteria bacterium]MBT3488459.1 hypothetical protein [Gammaproteobacteria bacterium]MBT3719865.1 hypothetical protein [Gammaproteobacteria bacterium]MBT3846170.1 hypothetical protein [Gammaproteobacteria bacterium]MBT3893188.1 hypothetical protein [Gammaproteobacteria bacterium]
MSLILTGSARQARFLRDRWAKQQLESGRTAWETPPILSLQAWMRQQWEHCLQQGVTLPLLLSPDQERRVWQQCRPDQLRDAEGFLRQGDLIDHAMRANRLFHLWREDDEFLGLLLNDTHLEEMELFALWQQQFEEQCQQHQWLAGAGLAELLGELLLDNVITLPQRLEHYGRSQWCRAEQRLLEVLEQSGVVLKEVELPRLQVNEKLVVSADPDREVEAAVSAIKDCLQATPEARVGVVVPGLTARRRQLEVGFSEQLAAQSAVMPVLASQLPYRFSSGDLLLDDPRIHHALQLLKLAQQGLPLLEVSALLRSPWLLLGAEMEARSVVELQLRGQSELEVSLHSLIRQLHPAGEDQLPSAPRFLGALQALEGLDLLHSTTTHHWAEHFTRALAFFEWAENGEQSHIALAAYNGWREGMDRFVALGEFLHEIEGRKALSELRQLLSSIELESGSGGRQTVEILTPEEAEGVQFDLLWVMGCDDRQWPQSNPICPFLPQQWQRERIPRVDHLGAQQQSQKRFERFRACAKQLFFSYSESESAGAEEQQHVTPLLSQVVLDEMDPQEANPQETNPKETERWWLPQQPLELEPIEDYQSQLPAGSHVRGGSGLLVDQSQCPFRAFVRHRLQARSMEQPQSGLDARQRGTLLHELLERCWREIGRSSEQLHKIDEPTLQQTIYKIAAGTVEQFRDTRKGAIGPRFSENEVQRLSAMTLSALQLDRQRVLPFVVEEMEQQHQIELGGVVLSIKMDRVDRTEDGRRILIDYKSGKVNRADWEGERPKAPQLPLYAILLEQVAAVLYSQIKADEVLYKGEQQEEAVLAGAQGGKRRPAVTVSENWSAQLKQWHHAVEALAIEFRNGVATVDPQKGSSSCQYCGLEPLCRVEL